MAMKTYADYTPEEIEQIINDPKKMAELQAKYDSAILDLYIYESVKHGEILPS